MGNSFLTTVIVTASVIMACFGNPAPTVNEMPAPSEQVISQPASSADKNDDITYPQIQDDDFGDEKIYPDNRKILYRYIPESGLYDTSKLLEFSDEADYNDIFNEVTAEVFPDSEIPEVLSIVKTKEFIVCNFDDEWLDTFNKGQLHEFCNTLVMTLCKNGYCENVGFRINGEVGLLGGEVWDLAELKILQTADADQFRDLRAEIPYGGMRLNGGESYFYLAKSLKGDNMAEKILKVMRLAGELTNEFDHPSDMDMKNAVQSLIWSTEPIYINTDSENYDVETVQKIAPITASVSQRLGFQETCFWMKEHIEETAYLVFGKDVVIKHCEPSLPYKWFETEGVYTPPHMGGAWRVIPHIYRYSVENDTVTVEAAYLREYMQGVYDAINDKFTDNYDEIEEYLEKRAQRHIVKLQVEPDGRLTVRQHYLKNLGGN